MDLGEAVLTLRTNDQGLSSGLDEAKKKVDAATTAFNNVGIAITAALGFSEKLLKAWADSEAAATRLNASVEIMIGKYTGIGEELRLYSEELMRASGYEHEAIQNGMAQAVTLGRTKDQVKELALAATELANAGIMPLDDAMKQLDLTYEGNLRMLGRMFPELKNLTKEQLANGEAVKIIETRVKGMNEAMMATTQGGLRNFKNMFSELLESMGKVVAIYAGPAMKAFSALLEKVADFISATVDLRAAQNAVEAGTATSTQALVKWADTASSAKEEIKRLAAEITAYNKTWAAGTEGGKQHLDDLNASLKHQGDVLTFANNQITGYKQLQDEAAAAVKKHADVIVDHFNPSIDDMAVRWMALGEAVKKVQDYHLTFFYRADSGWSQTVNSMVGESDKLTRGWSEKVNTMVTDSSIGWNKIANDMTGSLETMKVEQWAWAAILVSSMKDTFEAIGKFLADGAKDWEGLGVAAIHAVGKIVSVMGDMLAADAAATLVKAIANSLDPFTWFASPGEFASWALKVAGAAAAWATGAALQSVTHFAGGGDFTVPPGYPNDSYPMRVESGEHVTVTPAGGGGGDMIHNTLVLDGSVLADWVTKASRNKRILTTARSVVP